MPVLAPAAMVARPRRSRRRTTPEPPPLLLLQMQTLVRAEAQAAALALARAAALAVAQVVVLAADRVPQLVVQALRLRRRTASSARCKEWVFVDKVCVMECAVSARSQWSRPRVFPARQQQA
ncbi:hypothetical protein PF004_g32030 [Phytophthora fragariae]|uniref:Uncharacterized protein n=1 Tax=Phytophthora fragariae TaxID=53985 RepID=A0A6G0M8C0_9STRA|nr:hypothetical protein PF004_g32030 [Phytophthora fragariae]